MISHHITSYVDIDTRAPHSLPPFSTKIELNLTVIIIYYSNFYYILKILISCKNKKKNDMAGIMVRVFSNNSRIDRVSEVFTGYKIWRNTSYTIRWEALPFNFGKKKKKTPNTLLIHSPSHMKWDPHHMNFTSYERVGVYKMCIECFYITSFQLLMP
jgi:hypothetical protein